MLNSNIWIMDDKMDQIKLVLCLTTRKNHEIKTHQMMFTSKAATKALKRQEGTL